MGALTKAPFNALTPIYDLNNALVACLLTGEGSFLAAAGYVGPKYRVDHDISLLVPKLWCRMGPEERDPSTLMAEGSLERGRDFTHAGRTVLFSRMGWRITGCFCRKYLGRIFNHPQLVFTEEMLRPELLDPDIFARSMEVIVATHQRVARHYFQDGSIALACPPLRALLHIMRDGAWEGKGLRDPAVRAQFTREHLLAGAWYAERLQAQAAHDERPARTLAGNLERFASRAADHEVARELRLDGASRPHAKARRGSGNASAFPSTIGTLMCASLGDRTSASKRFLQDPLPSWILTHFSERRSYPAARQGENCVRLPLGHRARRVNHPISSVRIQIALQLSSPTGSDQGGRHAAALPKLLAHLHKRIPIGPATGIIAP